jgi:alginate O-acetyltransferase complex protein AlgI
MLFQTREFLLFFLIVLVLLTFIKQRKAQVAMLLLASYVFYSWWNILLLGPILFSTIWDFFSAKQIYKSKTPAHRKRWLLASLTVDLGMLAWFKYYNFFIDSANDLLVLAGGQPALPILNIILPVGISFYTFEAISYAVDVYKGRCKPCNNLIEFALYLAYFPHLVAGPILRPWDFLPQITERKTITRTNFQQGIHLFLVGLFKKVLIADNLALFSDSILSKPQGQSSLAIVLATLTFGVRIYCDFSGYSDMGRGISRIMNIELPLNFNRPYLATSIQEFWHRWHISLSTWLRDYLYIPLGGSRSGNTYVNLMITMILGGFWHGAAWNFVFWGAYQGGLLIAHKVISTRLQQNRNIQAFLSNPSGKFISWLVTQYFVFMGWIFFYVSSVPDIIYCVKKYLFFDFNFSVGGAGFGQARPFTTVSLLIIFVVGQLIATQIGGYDKLLNTFSPRKRVLTYAALSIMLFILWPIADTPFIYFQF